jgi:hypothetical protein
MPREKISQGRCAYCQQEIAKNAVTKHLAKCAERQQALAQAEAKSGKAEKLYHLRVENAYLKEFWLDLEMRGSASLAALDDYLRHIWLECCGHMSEFTSGGFGTEEFDKDSTAQEVFEWQPELLHLYDFGTTSETKVKVVGAREGKPMTKRPIELLARNLRPDAQCIECGKPAELLCNECLIEEDTSGMLCEDCAEDHPHEEYGEPIPLYNSPRMGMCGYEGPAEPPY